MYVIVTYDVSTISSGGQRRLRKIAKTCENYGQRVQNSVFECLVEPAQWTLFRSKLVDIIDEEKDSLRFYFLGKNWKKRVEHVGTKSGFDPQGPIIV